MQIPNLVEKPNFDTLVAVLESLDYRKCYSPCMKDRPIKDSFSFLISVIKDDLSWLSPDEKDVLYDIACKRIAEKCGRTATPEIIRVWMIPETIMHPKLEISLREPSLIGDNLGLKTWATSFAISKDIGNLGRNYFSHLLTKKYDIKLSSNQCISGPSTRVLELGSGTGLVGITAAAVWDVPVLCTDIESVQENLGHNIRNNLQIVSKSASGSVSCKILDWRIPEKAFPELGAFELIISTDPLYDDFHPLLLARTVDIFLKKDFDSRFLIAIPFRDKHTIDLSRKFKTQILLRQFSIAANEMKICKDEDWTSISDDAGVEIEMTIWQRCNIEH